MIRRAAVIGHPVAHSLSPALHRAAYRALGLTDWTYEAIDVDVADLAGFVAGLDGHWAGVSVTMPHKVALGRLMHHVEPLAELLGVVNTVLVQPGAPVTLVGANTDVHGVVHALGEILEPATARGPAVVLGGGATAASTLAALAQLGFGEPLVQVRSTARAGSTMRAAHAMGIAPRFVTVNDHRDAVSRWNEADVLVSTLPPRAADAFASALLDADEPVRGVLLDCAYDPSPTALVQAWRRLGGTAAGGERMLVHQAAEQVRLMTGLPAPITVMNEALASAMSAGPTDAEDSGDG